MIWLVSQSTASFGRYDLKVSKLRSLESYSILSSYFPSYPVPSRVDLTTSCTLINGLGSSKGDGCFRILELPALPTSKNGSFSTIGLFFGIAKVVLNKTLGFEATTAQRIVERQKLNLLFVLAYLPKHGGDETVLDPVQKYPLWSFAAW